ncbi:MAG TPA: pyridoxamine 5'-phosphate oxidase family protein [Nocardioides sp.]|uniref:pyridoxamine 5'-phosphate oxidase family protein n=1 Tax=Nocardioides sp. TaxID=35761 RepID=UPI002E357C81|nr:pyridoxamine 5'-phosphate oxidase family protein [Nocardioides sp.]HEX5089265.1 pyridoxamine 5'-phosphate oxidase family protein [Nocardioides sp.]
MANQRAQVVMDDDEVWEFLRRQRSSTVATYGPQGRIHLVGMWYAVIDGQVWIESKAKSQKVVNLRRDPRMSFLVEAGHTYDQLRGVSLEGAGVVVEDPAVVWDVCVDVFGRYNGDYSEDMRPFVEVMAKNRVAVRLDVDRVRSWDHRKLGLPPMELGGSTAHFVE